MFENLCSVSCRVRVSASERNRLRLLFGPLLLVHVGGVEVFPIIIAYWTHKGCWPLMNGFVIRSLFIRVSPWHDIVRARHHQLGSINQSHFQPTNRNTMDESVTRSMLALIVLTRIEIYHRNDSVVIQLKLRLNSMTPAHLCSARTCGKPRSNRKSVLFSNRFAKIQ